MTGGGEDDSRCRTGVEWVKRMRCKSCERELMPGNGLRLRDYDQGKGVVIIAFCNRECLIREEGGVRGRQEIERRREKANIRINSLYKTDAKIEREEIVEETLDWVLGEVDDL